MPRYVAWERRPRRVGAKKGRRKVKGAEHRAEKKNTSTTTPGAVERPSPGSAPSAEEPAIDPEDPRTARLLLAYSARTQFALRGWLLVSASRRAAGSSLVAHPRGAAALANFRGRR